MKFDLPKTPEIIAKTPKMLYALLHDISDDWIYNNEGENTWSAFDVVGHLIVCELTDFIPRTEMILSSNKHKLFQPIDMHAQFKRNEGKRMADLPAEFEQLRKANIQTLPAFNLTDNDLKKQPCIHRSAS